MVSKDQVRGEVLERRKARSPEEMARAGAALAERVLALWEPIAAEGGTRVACYLGFGNEPPTTETIDALCKHQAEVIVPVVLSGGVLDWTAYHPDGETATNRYGIAEPTGPRLGAEALDEVDLVVVPGLAVDPQGHRLGRGAGFYDRALARIGSDVPRAILLYETEVLGSVPHEEHDERVDVALTPSWTLQLWPR